MFKSTRFRKLLLFTGLLAINEEATIPEMVNLTEADSAQVMVGNTNSKNAMQEFLQKHHLKIGGNFETSEVKEGENVSPAPRAALKTPSSSVSV